MKFVTAEVPAQQNDDSQRIALSTPGHPPVRVGRSRRTLASGKFDAFGSLLSGSGSAARLALGARPCPCGSIVAYCLA